MDNDVLHLGSRDTWGGAEVPFGVADEDLARHLFVLGKTGTGKSTLLKSIVVQKIAAGEGVALLDPHGDLADEVLDYVPRWRFDDIVHFDPADRDYPIGFNPLARVPKDNRERVASGFVAALRSVWRDYFGPRMEYILHATILALLECQNVTVLAIQRLLTDRQYLQSILRQVKDPVVKRFFEYEYLRWDDHFRQEAVSSILNKTGQLILAPMVRNILGQVRCRIDCRFMMDRKRILIANLAKGRLGDDVSSLMGSLLVTSFSQAVMARVDVPTAERVPFTLVVDEFATFGSDIFASIVAEARKYGLRLVVASQYLAQVNERVRAAIFGNVGNLLSFRVGEEDAAILQREYGYEYTAHTFSSLPNFHVAAKVLNRGVHAEPCIARTEPYPFPPAGTRAMAIERSRQKYAARRHVVESKIERWFANGRQERKPEARRFPSRRRTL